VLYTAVYWKTIFCIISSSKKKKHQLLHLCHTYCTVLYERHSGKSIKQLLKVKGFEYLQHSN